MLFFFFFFSSRRRHTRCGRDWSSDVCSSDLPDVIAPDPALIPMLARLQGMLGGALAIVTGRQLEVLDHFLAPLHLPAACEHGLQRRDGAGRLHPQPLALPETDRKRVG